MSRDQEKLLRALHGDRSIPWEKAASYFVRVKKASIRKQANDEIGLDHPVHKIVRALPHIKKLEDKYGSDDGKYLSAYADEVDKRISPQKGMQKKADLGSPQSQPQGEHMGGYGSNYGKVDPGTLMNEGVRERTRPQEMQPNIHDAEGMGVSPEELQYQRSMARVEEDAELGQVQAENEAAFYQQKAEEASAAAEQAQMSAEQAQQAAQQTQEQMAQVQQQADMATQQAQAQAQQASQGMQMSQQEAMAANEQLMQLRQGIQNYRQQLQQLVLTDPAAPPPPQIDPATGQPIDPAAAQGQPPPGMEQAAPQQEQAPPEAMPKQGQVEGVTPMLSQGSPEMPPGMPGQPPPGMEMGVPEEEMQGEGGMGMDLENMPDEELMALMQDIQGELELRDQEEAEAEAEEQKAVAEANDAEHQQAMGLAEGAVAASKTAGVRIVRQLCGARPFVKAALAGVDASKAPALEMPEAPDLTDKTRGQIQTPTPKAARVAEGGSYEKRVNETPQGMLKAEKTAEAINYIPPRRYGIDTDGSPGSLEKSSDWGQRAVGALVGGGLGAGIQSLSDRPGKTGKSDTEIVLGERLKEMAKNKNKGVLDRYKEVITRAMHGTAQINRENPRVSAALAGLTGATAGAIATPALIRGLHSALAHFSKK